MTTESVMNAIISIFVQKFPSVSGPIEEKMDIEFTAPEIGLDNIQLYEFLMCVEESFSVFFTPQEIREIGFNTLNNACCLVSNKLAE